MTINRLAAAHEYMGVPTYVTVAKGVAVGAAIIGVVASFWHMSWIAGVVLLVSGVLGVAAQSIFYVRMDRDLEYNTTGIADEQRPPPQGGD
ncbi:MAG TPA: hypothetical protein VE172_17415 [Stackebrandtia sp.]|uniref:hypothetical protein n=1 Tax=Stackebrandtia sp. TaxID=2023065 RepID=UPI002D666EAD|nr:hypothetical protein [Stackebrandtia sp.]HZE40584.1 hypothetical protein [Stackebrandtia sp.]